MIKKKNVISPSSNQCKYITRGGLFTLLPTPPLGSATAQNYKMLVLAHGSLNKYSGQTKKKY